MKTMPRRKPTDLAKLAASAMGRLGGAAGRGAAKRRTTSFSTDNNPKVAATHAVELEDGSFIELHVQATVAGYEAGQPFVRSSSPAATNWLRRRGWVRTMRTIEGHGRPVSTWSLKST